MYTDAESCPVVPPVQKHSCPIVAHPARNRSL